MSFVAEKAMGPKAIAADVKKPPSAKAMMHLGEARSKVETAIDSIKASGRALGALNIPDTKKTYTELLQRALGASKKKLAGVHR